MLMILDNCSRQSRMENFPCSSFFCISFCLSGLARAMSCLLHQLSTMMNHPEADMCSIKPCISPIPSNFEMKG